MEESRTRLYATLASAAGRKPFKAGTLSMGTRCRTGTATGTGACCADALRLEDERYQPTRGRIRHLLPPGKPFAWHGTEGTWRRRWARGSCRSYRRTAPAAADRLQQQQLAVVENSAPVGHFAGQARHLVGHQTVVMPRPGVMTGVEDFADHLRLSASQFWNSIAPWSMHNARAISATRCWQPLADRREEVDASAFCPI